MAGLFVKHHQPPGGRALAKTFVTPLSTLPLDIQ
jgi:hypothetical protein